MVDHRPVAHLRPETGWMNDPIGPIRWRGRTHLFHQANPAGGFWDRPHWGHFATADLVHWERRPLALSPDADGPDADGCYSGCVVDDDGVATMLYTGARGPLGHSQAQTTCVARSTDDDLDTWTKDPENPVAEPPPDLDLLGYRDPFVWSDGGRWHQLIGAGIVGQGGAVLHLTSDDLRSWTDEGPLLTGATLDAADVDGAAWTGTMWECPALLRGPDADALIVNVHDDTTASPKPTHHPVAVIGRLADGAFTPRRLQRVDAGPDLYAPCLLVEPSGAVMWGWSWEALPVEAQRAAGWSGVLSLPRAVQVVDGQLVVTPLPELDDLRTDARRITRVARDGGWRAEGAEGDVVDLVLRVAVDRGPVELAVRCAPDRAEVTTIGFDPQAGRLWLDRDRSSLDPAATGGTHTAAATVPDEVVELRCVVDRSIVEVFVAGVALTARIYPTRPDSVGVEVTGPGADAVDLAAYDLGSVWVSSTSG